MSKIECKYKFYDAEKFDGKPYCTLQNELCEDLNFACDDNCQVYEDYKQLKRKEQECEELTRELQAQRAFTSHEQRLIYCVAYDESCKTGNDCKQEKCIFKDNIKLKKTLAEIKEIAENGKRFAERYMITGELKTNVLTYANAILQKISEVVK